MSQWHTVSPHTRPLTLSILELTPLALTLALTLAPSQSNHSLHPAAAASHLAHTHHAHATVSHARRKKPRPRRDSDDELTAVEDDDTHTSTGTPGDSQPSFKDILSHGVVVSVNGQPWSRIFAHVSDIDDTPVLAGPSPIDEEEEGEWIDDLEHAEAGQDGSKITQRRPRRARFSVSAEQAIREGGTRRRREAGRFEKIDRDRAVVVVYGLAPGKEYEVDIRVVGVSSQDVEPSSGSHFET